MKRPRERRPRRRVAAALGVASALSAVLAGCTSDEPRARHGTDGSPGGSADGSGTGTDGGARLDAGGDVCARLPQVDASAYPLAPDFPDGATWLNTSKAYRLADLRGQVVLLDFWTYGCINCLHQLPVVSKIEDTLRGRPFVVIGVHSSKFTSERDQSNIQLAMEQYGVRHPVVVDDTLAIWDAYEVNGWPTAVLIDAEGRRRGMTPGEYGASDMLSRVEALLGEAACEGTAARPSSYLVDPNAGATTPLYFPTGLAPLPDGGLAISDSSHQRIVLMKSEGVVDRVFGTGARGFADGTEDKAKFNGPQGLTVSGNTLYVADAGNHALRAIDLATNAVTTVAGTGLLGSPLGLGSAPALSTRLNSPWDVEPVPGGIALALAGDHQLALFDPGQGELRLLSGMGSEGLLNGPATACQFAQPSGVAASADGATLYVADAESSAIRAVALSDGSCSTLVGHGLATFGDQDGVGSDVLLQHTSALDALGADELVLADTYNSKLKRLVPSTKAVSTLDYPPAGLDLAEPRGVAHAGTRVFVSDTNHHRVLVHDLSTGDTHVYDLGTLAPPVRPDAGQTVTGDASTRTDASTPDSFPPEDSGSDGPG